MDKFNLLDCTLRDGGYVIDWKFNQSSIKDIIHTLARANMDFIEVGYLNHYVECHDTTQFKTIEEISGFLPKGLQDVQTLAMADVQQFSPEDLTSYTGNSISGIRVVFYKHQIEEAIRLGEAVKGNGYKLFMQPMVTIDYTLDEYARITKRIAAMKPYAVSIVDSFGYMLKDDFRRYFKVLDNILDQDVVIGFHSHNNMNLAFITAQDILEYGTTRRIIIDASLYGMGRGAGNLNTELIANYYNMTLGDKYDIKQILRLIGSHILPIYDKKKWGYSPYLFITGLYHYHPNFACYLLDEYEVTVQEFEEFIHTIPEEMKTVCRKPYVLEMWNKYKNRIDS